MNQELFVSIFHNNVKSSLKNSMFDIQNNKMTEVPIFVKLKLLLKQNNINLNTYDIVCPKPSYINIHWDMPYPTPSNFHIWKRIFFDRKKNILIATEPPTVNPFNYMKIFHGFFTKIYTWNDQLVKNNKYVKFRLPKASTGIKTKALKFQNKKFLIMVNSNKSFFYPFKLFSPFGRELYSERIRAVDFFQKTIPDKFFLYGRGWNKTKKHNLKEFLFSSKKYSTYKGEIDNKIKLLSGFKYCLCFENLTNVKGFITEKIFDCFKARCIPVYWGATDIEKYIPKNCFIDFRDFRDFKKLLLFLDSVNEKKYDNYIKNIEKFMMDKKLIEPWFEDGFSNFFLEKILEFKK
ncbi:MAG: hypothetical protein HYT07_02495 [Candidatus Levybacteria bacterium]|nr:hypothetical protein [Candidatus Levybacteria bacterium]